MVTPTMFPVDKKTRAQKKVSFIVVLIPWYPISYLTIASSVFFLGVLMYGSLDAAIWWCLRTGGGGVLTRLRSVRQTSERSFYFMDIIFNYYELLFNTRVLYYLPCDGDIGFSATPIN
jgi:hypothetical protein